MDKRSKFNKISKDIKSIKIQGARNVAIAGFNAYKLIPNERSKQKLISIRSTEPMLENLLEIADKLDEKELIKKLKQNQEIINKKTLRLIKQNSIIFTHCHSSAVVMALINAKKKGKKFEVYNTETRPLFQGRKTSRDLKKAKIKNTMFTDSAAGIALTKSQDTKKADLFLIGADAITKNGVINKVGSGMFAQIARANEIPVYILTDSLKYSKKKIKIEKRNPEEVWDSKNTKIKNPAFELIKKKYITGIISELGILSHREFLRKVRKN
jgi:ribose 1,5-bisphosphate isomerase